MVLAALFFYGLLIASFSLALLHPKQFVSALFLISSPVPSASRSILASFVFAYRRVCSQTLT